MRKIYHRDPARDWPAKEKFSREWAAYKRLNGLGTDFVPRLLDANPKELWLEIERVASGRTLIDWLNEAPHNSFEPVVTQLLRIDSYLYKNRINYLGGLAEGCNGI